MKVSVLMATALLATSSIISTANAARLGESSTQQTLEAAGSGCNSGYCLVASWTPCGGGSNCGACYQNSNGQICALEPCSSCQTSAPTNKPTSTNAPTNKPTTPSPTSTTTTPAPTPSAAPTCGSWWSQLSAESAPWKSCGGGQFQNRQGCEMQNFCCWQPLSNNGQGLCVTPDNIVECVNLSQSECGNNSQYCTWTSYGGGLCQRICPGNPEVMCKV